ncbi:MULTISPECIES: sulfur carrier protein ThiS [Priestia]|uniref:Thiamine biosynthesis protein ThiS n=5 Tax=Priestia TaxID=2800373 RepID=D5DYW5_PRIM1|nr:MULTISPECIES: sulfur carrier protein ThiS [Priestia]AVX06716.1 thiamine biosynthesis protein ThiS [Bacillus sp. Y-01]KOP72920.1 thiamine biosynthesis protein ThiS [Bacillus sp. FJAT-21351]KQU24861.1 thiamine biosynthesis protein ThiS [Bacillus sp. Leaf75]KRD82080.1 thiamine biosynthesis protein ThiS [Bacillus sp. Root147]KRF52343.1 thiamine biosynthesis protein ThiS [Bacillus sp. Soil531]MBZ5482263.1 sulfur carrier protein ThiS [Bacillus sp. T_4]MCF6799350.1 sulfur carrier protein ThiS [B
MNLIINGKTVTFGDEIETVEHLLQAQNLHERVVIVELNKNILQKEEHSDACLKDGDILEVVSFVGGG